MEKTNIVANLGAFKYSGFLKLYALKNEFVGWKYRLILKRLACMVCCLLWAEIQSNVCLKAYKSVTASV